LVISVLDASAVLRFLLGEAGDQRVEEILEGSQRGASRAVISAINCGEVVGKIYQSQGRLAAEALATTLQFYGLEIVPVTADRAARAAVLKVDLKLGYADAICVELAASLPNSTIITADYDFVAATALVAIEFLPNKPKP
jgi:PIN domain nuclease of toxin-antitoxin system